MYQNLYSGVIDAIVSTTLYQMQAVFPELLLTSIEIVEKLTLFYLFPAPTKPK